MTDADAVVAGLVEQGDPQRSGLGSDGHVAGRRPRGGECRVKCDFRIGIQDAETVGADDPQRRPRELENAFLRALADSPDSPNPALTISTAALVPAVAHRSRRLRDPCGRDGDDREMDRLRKSCDALIRANPLHVVRGRVDRIDGTGERTPRGSRRFPPPRCCGSATRR